MMKRNVVLHLCHGYESPFAECARHYVSLFNNTNYKVITVFIVGNPNQIVANYIGGDKVIFLGFESKDLKGMKLRVLFRLKQLLRDLPLTLCIAHRSKPTWLACLVTSVPIISVHHAFGDYRRPLKRWAINFFRKRLLMIGVSNAVERDLRNFFPHWPQNKITTLHNRIDYKQLFEKQYAKQDARFMLGLEIDTWLFVNAGRLHPMKDQVTLIKAFSIALPAMIENTKLVICGKGNLKNELLSLVNSLGIADKVIFLGFIADVSHYFKAFDCFVLTSNDEPFGMVLLEAMTAGIPVISSASGGSTEVIGNIGKVFSVGDIDELAKYMVAQQHSLPDENLLLNSHSHLAKNFSDEAARKTFWQLPEVQSMVGGDKTS